MDVDHCLVPGCSFEGLQRMIRVFHEKREVWSGRSYSVRSRSAGELEEAYEKKTLSLRGIAALAREAVIVYSEEVRWCRSVSRTNQPMPYLCHHF